MLELLAAHPEVVCRQRLLAGTAPEGKHATQVPRLLGSGRLRLLIRRPHPNEPRHIHQRAGVVDQDRPDGRDCVLSFLAIRLGKACHLMLKRLQGHTLIIVKNVKNVKRSLVAAQLSQRSPLEHDTVGPVSPQPPASGLLDEPVERRIVDARHLSVQANQPASAPALLAGPLHVAEKGLRWRLITRWDSGGIRRLTALA
jgi:hypothetical protein